MICFVDFPAVPIPMVSKVGGHKRKVHFCGGTMTMVFLIVGPAPNLYAAGFSEGPEKESFPTALPGMMFVS